MLFDLVFSEDSRLSQRHLIEGCPTILLMPGTAVASKNCSQFVSWKGKGQFHDSAYRDFHENVGTFRAESIVQQIILVIDSVRGRDVPNMKSQSVWQILTASSKIALQSLPRAELFYYLS